MFYSKYLKQRAVPFKNWIFPSIKESKLFSSIITIPSYCESNHIMSTLDSLSQQSNFDLSSLLVLVVINNEKEAALDIVEDNLKTIELIANYQCEYALEYIDAFSNGNSLPDNLAGVGYSRKIGMDFGLKYSSKETIFHCLDADTIVSKNYLSKIKQIYKNESTKALLVDFKHQDNENKPISKHIRDYEVFLKQTALDIDKAGSPYGYVALGPTITCLAETYVKVGGMVNKKATEDFYFLQQIRKFTEIDFLKEELVFPSSRLSNRVYLGTGFRMSQLLEGKKIIELYYSEKSYKILNHSIRQILSSYRNKKTNLNQKLLAIDNSLPMFFSNEGLFKVWDKINNESNNINQFKLQFHKWFDNLKTLRLLKFYS